MRHIISSCAIDNSINYITLLMSKEASAINGLESSLDNSFFSLSVNNGNMC